MRPWVAATALVVALAAITPGSMAFAQATPYWPSEQDERIKQIDGEILDLQRQRFQVVFAENKDEDAVRRLNDQFRELQKERRRLLKAGRQL